MGVPLPIPWIPPVIVSSTLVVSLSQIRVTSFLPSMRVRYDWYAIVWFGSLYEKKQLKPIWPPCATARHAPRGARWKATHDAQAVPTLALGARRSAQLGRRSPSWGNGHKNKRES